MFFIRSILGFSWVAISANRWSHDDLQRMLGVPSLLTLMQRRLASWIGHLVRMDLARVPRQVLFGMVTSRRFPSSTQTTRRHSYQSRVNALLQQLPGVNFRIWFQQAQDRSFWASAAKALCIVPQTRSVGRAFDALCLAVFLWVGTPKVYSGTLLKNMQLASLLDMNFVARILPCAQCGQWFKSKAALGIHVTRKHP